MGGELLSEEGEQGPGRWGAWGHERGSGSVSTQQWPRVWELLSPLPLRGRVIKPLCASWVLIVRSLGDTNVVRDGHVLPQSMI